MKFEIKDLIGGGYVLCKKSDDYLIWLGDIYLRKEKYKDKSSCVQNENRFSYHGIENALCGKTWGKNEYYTLKRILVIQMDKNLTLVLEKIMDEVQLAQEAMSENIEKMLELMD